MSDFADRVERMGSDAKLIDYQLFARWLRFRGYDVDAVFSRSTGDVFFRLMHDWLVSGGNLFD